MAVFIDIAKLSSIEVGPVHASAVGVWQGRRVPGPHQPTALPHSCLKQALKCDPFMIWELIEFSESVLIQ